MESTVYKKEISIIKFREKGDRFYLPNPSLTRPPIILGGFKVIVFHMSKCLVSWGWWVEGRRGGGGRGGGARVKKQRNFRFFSTRPDAEFCQCSLSVRSLSLSVTIIIYIIVNRGKWWGNLAKVLCGLKHRVFHTMPLKEKWIVISLFRDSRLEIGKKEMELYHFVLTIVNRGKWKG